MLFVRRRVDNSENAHDHKATLLTRYDVRDYGHYDGSSQMDATLIMRQRTDIDEVTKRKILYDNAKRLWGL